MTAVGAPATVTAVRGLGRQSGVDVPNASGVSDLTLPDYLRARIAAAGPDDCWPWTGHVNARGYPIAAHRLRRGRAHIVMFETVRGPVPADHELDHTCHDPKACAGGPTCPHRRCVNPNHLEPVSHAENMRRARRPVCKRGHAMDGPDGTARYGPTGKRYCSACPADWLRGQ